MRIIFSIYRIWTVWKWLTRVVTRVRVCIYTCRLLEKRPPSDKSIKSRERRIEGSSETQRERKKITEKESMCGVRSGHWISRGLEIQEKYAPKVFIHWYIVCITSSTKKWGKKIRCFFSCSSFLITHTTNCHAPTS